MFIQSARKLARRLGLEVTRFRPGSSYWASIDRMLHQHAIDLVLDVGANTGQFADALRASGYAGRMVSFEPLPEAYERLLHKARGDPSWVVAPRMAVGDIDGEIAINVAANSVSSSIAAMLSSHVEAAPESRYVGQQRAPIARLDSLAKDLVPANSRAFLKIDTQGYEARVLAGACELMQRLQGIQLELSLVPLYEGSVGFVDMIRALEAAGFELHGLFDAFSDPRSGRMLQVDAVFFRGGERAQAAEPSMTAP